MWFLAFLGHFELLKVFEAQYSDSFDTDMWETSTLGTYFGKNGHLGTIWQLLIWTFGTFL